jgi:hypothetical protein
MLNLHGQQQTALRHGENKQTVTSWMIAFVWSLQSHLGTTESLFSDSDPISSMSHDAQTPAIAEKMNTVVQHLGLAPFSQDQTFQGWLTPVSTSDIQPVWLLCPLSL